MEASGARFILVLVPAPADVDDEVFRQSIALSRFEREDFDREKPYRDLEAFAAANTIEVINPRATFYQRHSPDSSLYLVRDMHFSPKGHALFAEAIAGYLTRTAPPRPPAE